MTTSARHPRAPSGIPATGTRSEQAASPPRAAPGNPRAVGLSIEDMRAYLQITRSASSAVSECPAALRRGALGYG